MLKNSFLINILAVLLFFITANANAHITNNTNATLNILANSKYDLSIHVDILHIVKDKLAFQEGDAELIEHLSSFSLIETKRLLDSIRQSIQQHSFIFFDENKYAIPALSGLSVAEFKQLLTHLNFQSLPLTLVGDIPINTQKVAISFAPELGNVILTVAKPYKNLVETHSRSQDIYINNTHKPNETNDMVISQFDTFTEFLYQGYVHIVPKGLDHILFVLALFLLARKTSTLLWQISVFTLAHTITLALGIFDIINIPSSFVEPLIALSIAYVAIENIFQQKLTRARLPIIFAFGLLHGLGFASVLLELGLQPQQFITSLIAFNIGVEIGQLSVILVAFSLLCWFYKKDWYQRRIVMPMSIVIALIGVYWFIERAL
ncbi:HupE/UreJ family protein [Thalassotalea profundi]|uniref:HupE/UreJ family protein n=1 Tax=Thalassotalea profundi TaxID=2036687 RepID=A0ABQ3INI9_9GAMM|nr:HupE/UreJ family protein [Thalassotalea profundi]GHE87137.1 hypothetical protein GCM10011501_15570 [Thalassotalea profundi]